MGNRIYVALLMLVFNDVAYCDFQQRVIYKFDANSYNQNDWHLNNEAKYNINSLFKISKKNGLRIKQLKPSHISASWVSGNIDISRYDAIKVSSVISSNNVIPGAKLWHKVGITIHFLDSKYKYYKHVDLVRISGTNPERRFSKLIIFPKKAKFIRVLFGIINATGDSSLKSISITGIKVNRHENPDKIYPEPWHQVCKGEYIAFKNIKNNNNMRIWYELRNKLKIGRVINSKTLLENKRISYSMTINLIPIRISDPSKYKKYPELNNYEGYRLEVKNNSVIIKYTSDIGYQHAINTLVQLIKKYKNNYLIKRCVIRDYPALKVRGIASGPVNVKQIKNISFYKLNTIHIAGAPGVWRRWNKKILYSDKRYLFNLSKIFHKYNINAVINIWPGAYGRIFAWSSSKDRELIAEKILMYRNLGFNNVLIIMSHDYSRVGRGTGVISHIDVKQRLSLATAHYQLVNYLLARIKQYNIRLGIFPYYYLGSYEYNKDEKKYFNYIRKLPKNVYVIYGGRVSDRSIYGFNELIARKPVIRIPIPYLYPSRSRPTVENLDFYLSYMTSNLYAQLFKGIIVESPEDERELAMIANFLWNYHRKVTSILVK